MDNKNNQNEIKENKTDNSLILLNIRKAPT
jgi:hypothetical protein